MQQLGNIAFNNVYLSAWATYIIILNENAILFIDCRISSNNTLKH